ncbi:MAG: glycosyltransferase family 4 protein [Proteobacteria bacterium]|nr:glycosyltransferase family 4 protein [Pseudomonadota bacterium]
MDTTTDEPGTTAPPRDPATSRPAVIMQVLPALVTGGVERGTLDVAAAIVQAGGTALVASAGGPMVRELERLGARHVTLPLDRKAPWAILGNRRRLAALIVAEQVDIVHARSRAPAWSALGAARRTGRAFVTTFHGTYNFRSPWKRWYNAIMAKGDRVIAISEFIGQHIRENYAIDPAHLRVIPRGIDVVAFDPAKVTAERLAALSSAWRLPDGAPVVMLPGRLARWKGHATVITAVHRVARSDVVCVLVGGDHGRRGYRRELESLAQSLGITNRLRIVGDCRDMPAAYMLADVVVSASTDPEAFGRITAEASAMGRAVVATDHGGSRETIQPGTTGWLVPPGDSAALARAIDTVLNLSAVERVTLGARARAFVEERFSKARMCAATLQVYAELLDGP